MTHPRPKNLFSLLIATALITLPAVAAPQDEASASPEANAPQAASERVANSTDDAFVPVKKLGGSCHTTGLCYGLVGELFERILIQDTRVQLVVQPGDLKDLMVSQCGSDWSLWMPDDLPNRDLKLDQITIADALGQQIQINFDPDSSGQRCNLRWIYRVVD
ncbi:MAG: hypothetical protein AAF657_19815 [Acidobacteriota bacterium]